MKPSRWWLVLVALAGLAACSPASDDTVAYRHDPRAVAFDVAADPRSLDPLLAHADSNGSESELARLAFEPFFDVDDRGRRIPALLREIPTVRNGGLSRDGLTITYHLRDARWSDGVPVTGRDVLFTLRAIRDPLNPVTARDGYDRIVAASSPEPRTVVFRLRRPWAPAVATFFASGSVPQFVLPEHVLAHEAPLAEAPFGGAPTVGDGPYRFVTWRRGDTITYEANPHYWRGRPAVPRIDVHIVPDPNTNLVLMHTGAIDFDLIAPSQQASLRRVAGVRFRDVPTALVAGIAINTAHPPLDDPRVRRAFAEMLDRDGLARRVTLGKYPVAESDRPRFSWAHDASVREPRPDGDAAERDLAAAGLRHGEAGWLVKDGHLLELTYLLFPESTTGVKIGTLVQDALALHGVPIEQQTTSAAEMFLPEVGSLARGEYDLAYVPWTMSADPDDRFLYGCTGEQNWSHWCDGSVRDLERRAGGALDERFRRALYGAIDRRVARDVPIIWLFNPTYVYAYRGRLRNFRPNAFSPTWNAWQWRLDDDRRATRA